jgi:D-alanyl-lipoteichoic acid acyltransferase DltB (MBOAT superfamily)
MNLKPVDPTRRLTAWVLEIVLVIGTGYFGWLIWSFVIWGKGQTPAQNLLRMISINEKTGSAAKRPQMFIRFILVFAAYWLGYFAIANIAYVINPNGILLTVGTLMLIAFHLFDISGILRRDDRKRLAGVVIMNLGGASH